MKRAEELKMPKSTKAAIFSPQETEYVAMKMYMSDEEVVNIIDE